MCVCVCVCVLSVCVTKVFEVHVFFYVGCIAEALYDVYEYDFTAQ